MESDQDGRKGLTLCNTSLLRVIGVGTTTGDFALEKTYPCIDLHVDVYKRYRVPSRVGGSKNPVDRNQVMQLGTM